MQMSHWHCSFAWAGLRLTRAQHDLLGIVDLDQSHRLLIPSFRKSGILCDREERRVSTRRTCTTGLAVRVLEVLVRVCSIILWPSGGYIRLQYSSIILLR